MKVFTGGCLCGAIRYEFSGEILRTLNCHCDDCRRATGSSFGTFVFVNESDLTVLRGTPKSFEHPNDAGATMTKQFCENCGTHLFGKGSRAGGMIHVKVGTIDDAGFVRPEMDLFVSKKLPFVRLSDETEHFDQGRPR
jgi:hypothetical protein